MEEVKKHYSGKHKLYEYMVKVSVLRGGIGIRCSEHRTGSVSLIAITREMLSFRDDVLDKTEEEKAITDIGPHSDRLAGSWGVLLEKGYTGIESEVRAIVPRKKPQGRKLSLADRRKNEAKASDRVIVEIFRATG